MQNVQQTEYIDMGTRVCLTIAKYVTGKVTAIAGRHAVVEWDRSGRRFSLPMDELSVAGSAAQRRVVEEHPDRKLTVKREYKVEPDVTGEQLQQFEADGWTIQTMQFTPLERESRAMLNVVLVRYVPVDGGPDEDEEEADDPTEPVEKPGPVEDEPEEEDEEELAPAAEGSPAETEEATPPPAPSPSHEEGKEETPETEDEERPAPSPVAEHATTGSSVRQFDSGGGEGKPRTVEGVVMPVGQEHFMGEDEIASAFDEDDDDLPRMTYAQALKTPGISLEMLRRIGDREIRRAAEETFAAARAARESRPIEQDPAWVMRSTVLNGGTHG